MFLISLAILFLPTILVFFLLGMPITLDTRN